MSILEGCSFCHGWHKTLEEAQACEKVYKDEQSLLYKQSYIIKVLEKDYSIGAYPFRLCKGDVVKEGIIFYTEFNASGYSYAMDIISWYVWLRSEKDFHEIAKDLAAHVENNLSIEWQGT
jgi:hypothetical protein